MQENWDGTLTYVAARETYGMRPHVAHYSQPEPWLDLFYETMASLLEI